MFSRQTTANAQFFPSHSQHKHLLGRIAFKCLCLMYHNTHVLLPVQ